MTGSPAPGSPPLRLSRAAPRQAARPVRPGHRPAAARPRRRGRACRPPVPGRRHLRSRRRQAVRPPRPCRPARGQQPSVLARAVATSRAGHQRQLLARARSGEHGRGVPRVLQGEGAGQRHRQIASRCQLHDRLPRPGAEQATCPIPCANRGETAFRRAGRLRARHREPKPPGCADRDRRVGAAGCGLGDRGTRAHIGHYPRAPTGITPDGDLSYGVRAADGPASRHHRVGGLHPSAIGGLAPMSQPPVRTDSSQLPMPAASTVSSIQSSASGRSSPTSILSARSPIRRMPATCMSHFDRPRTPAGDRLVHRAAGGYRPVHGYQHPTGPLQVRARRLFSRFLVSREA
jgi:hypothetical protein